MNDKKNISNDDIYRALMNLTAQNTEIKEDIKFLKKNFEKELLEIKVENEKLKEENNELKQKIRSIQRNMKKNSIIIHGYQESDNENTLNTVLMLVNEKLESELVVQEVNNAYRIGIKETNKIRPIRLELNSYIKRSEIISHSRKLKGTGIYIRGDLTSDDLEELKLLKKHLAQAKKNNIPAKIQNFKLTVNGETYTYQDLKNLPLSNNDTDNEETSNNTSPLTNRRSYSAPPSPTGTAHIQNYSEDFESRKVEKSKQVIQESTKNLRSARGKKNCPLSEQPHFSERNINSSNKK